MRSRTRAPLLFVLIPYLIVGFSIYTVVRDSHHAQYGYAAFAGVNALLCGYAVLAYIGIRVSISDVAYGLVSLLMVDDKKVQRKPIAVGRPAPRGTIAWANVLHYGSEEPIHPAPRYTLTGRTNGDAAAPTPTPSAPVLASGPTTAQSVLAQLERYAAERGGHVVIRLEGSSASMGIEYPSDVDADVLEDQPG